MFPNTRTMASASQTGLPTRGAHVSNLSSRNISYPQQPLGTHLCVITVVRQRTGGGSSNSSNSSSRSYSEQLRRSDRLRTRGNTTPPAASGASVLATPPAAMSSATRAAATPVPDMACPASPVDSLPACLLRGSPPRRRLAAPLRNRGAPALLCPPLRRSSGTLMVCLTRSHGTTVALHGTADFLDGFDIALWLSLRPNYFQCRGMFSPTTHFTQ